MATPEAYGFALKPLLDTFACFLARAHDQVRMAAISRSNINLRYLACWAVVRPVLKELAPNMVQDFNVSPVAIAFDAGLVAFVAVGLVWSLT